MSDVKQHGDAAVKKYALQFDKVNFNEPVGTVGQTGSQTGCPVPQLNPQTLHVSQEEITEAILSVSDELKSAIQIAKDNITKFHEAQREEIKKIDTTPGVVCWRKSIAIQKVGLYIPGGTAPLFSTLLMLGIP
ncbi:MAG TPA: histidinol dehydrogenase, partial [Ferruginibacter sp.]|nr:histidinol dehydrogenase [Ferruginibacter sp.]